MKKQQCFYYDLDDYNNLSEDEMDDFHSFRKDNHKKFKYSFDAKTYLTFRDKLLEINKHIVTDKSDAGYVVLEHIILNEFGITCMIESFCNDSQNVIISCDNEEDLLHIIMKFF